MIGSEIPEGQGRVNSLLAECFEVLTDLRVSADEAGVRTIGAGTPVPTGTPVARD